MKLRTRLNQTWIHFILLGCVLFYLQGILFPAPKPVIGPLDSARQESLRQQWLASTGQLPTPEQQAVMEAGELDRDMLFQRAIAMHLHLYDSVVYQRLLLNMRFLQLGEGKTDPQLFQQALELRLHLGDEVVKRRLIQVMEQLVLAANPPAPVSEQGLITEFERRRAELRRPPRYSIEQLYFNAEREAQAPAVIASITTGGLSASEALELSSPFISGYRFTLQTPEQLARQFGLIFVTNLQQANPQPGSWVGPLRSAFGLHYVWVSEVEPERDATLDEVRLQLQRDLESRTSAAALKAGIDKLRADYEVRQ